MTTDLATWLRAQLDADEQAARKACSEESADWVLHCEGGLVRPSDWSLNNGRDEWVADCLSDAGPHIALHDPARVLREVAAKRALIEGEIVWSMGGPDHYDFVLRPLAAVYADRPGWREEWR